MLGADYAGVLQRDGWAPYRQFTHAAHQTCLAHLLRRCRTMMLDHPHHRFAPRSTRSCAPRWPRVIAVTEGIVSDHGLAVARGAYVNRLGHLLARRPSRLADARRFAMHLTAEYDGRLQLPLRSDARRHQLARRARPPARRRHAQDVWRRQSHPRGAHTQQVLASLLRTAQQRGLDTHRDPDAPPTGAEARRPRRLSVSSATLTR